ncbi:hypothetical protein [Burkholderia sp. S171]|uniref:hypothetical protein n=1 Tax=Burkholderia sp. S171 TaxID=1641860 RepID=UPI00131A921F|nr:hypothetical protein [Burkholderia sp. S171]
MLDLLIVENNAGGAERAPLVERGHVVAAFETEGGQRLLDKTESTTSTPSVNG